MRLNHEQQLMRSIGLALKRVRKKHDITQEEAAEQIGITVEHYARIERGQALPGLLTFSRISVVMDVSADVLLDRCEGTFVPGSEPPSWFIPTDRPVRKQLRRLNRRISKLPPEIISAVESVLKQLERFVDRVQAAKPTRRRTKAPAKTKPRSKRKS